MTIPLGILASSKSGTAIWTSPTITSRRYTNANYNPFAGSVKYIAGSFGSTNYSYSTDGVTWSASPTTVSNSAYGYTSSYWVRIGSDGAFYSSDGTTWTSATGGGTTVSKMITWDGTRALYSTYSGTTCTIRHATTGTAWTSFTVTNGGDNLAFDGTSAYMIIPASASATGKVCTSNPTVAGNWSSITLPATATDWSGIVSNGSTWMVKSNSNNTTYYTSTNNGSTWTTRTLPTVMGESGDQFIKPFYANGLFYYYFNGNVYTSPDAVTWTANAVPNLEVSAPIYKATGWLFDGSKVQAFGMSTSGTANQAATAEYLNGAY